MMYCPQKQLTIQKEHRIQMEGTNVGEVIGTNMEAAKMEATNVEEANQKTVCRYKAPPHTLGEN